MSALMISLRSLQLQNDGGAARLKLTAEARPFWSRRIVAQRLKAHSGGFATGRAGTKGSKARSGLRKPGPE